MAGSSVGAATLLGSVAILLWGSLALLATLAGPVPPFLLTAITFGLAGIVGTGFILLRGSAGRGAVAAWATQSPRAWAIGVGGLFGYHLLFFVALRAAPAVQANLINYLWPLCIVVFSAFLPGERLRWFHCVGGVLGLAGTVLLVGGPALAVQIEYLPGYLAALGAALCWGGYSVLSRRYCAAVPTDFVAALCLVTALLAGLCHLILEAIYIPSAHDWLIMAIMGAGPLGAAFFFWDVGVKRGLLRALGAASYATPLLSTLGLYLGGRAQITLDVLFAAVLIVGGAVLAGSDALRGKRSAA
jgi:drug/metabolite transporter (DMT)-like permease